MSIESGELGPEDGVSSTPVASLTEKSPVTKQEVWGWYVYDWANSPFWQVADILFKIILLRLAEMTIKSVTWHLGTIGQSCDNVCSGIEQQCAEQFWPRDETFLQNVSTISCNMYMNNSTAQPFSLLSPSICSHADCGGNIGKCWLGSSIDDTTCATSDYRFQRLCPCADLFMGIMSAGSYPAFTLWCTSALQVIFLVSVAPFGDYGANRKRLLKALTWAGSMIIFLIIVCVSNVMWWFAGLIRIGVGLSFSLCNAFYNAYLPLLAASHPDVLKLKDRERADKEIEVSDNMSNKGMLAGYSGGMLALIIAYVILLCFECDPKTSTCTEFAQLFWPCLCVAFVGIWWAGFSMYTFKHLKTREGPPFPKDTNKFCLGWRQFWQTLRSIVKLRQTFLFVIVFFISSDALQTTQNVSILQSAGKQGKDSRVLMDVILAILGAIVGLFCFGTIQSYFVVSNKVMLITLCTIYGCICALAGADVLDLQGIGFYILYAPLVFMMGSLQSNSRALFSSLTPLGMEAAMFALYSITDKGSALLGAFVIGVVHTNTGSYIGVFWYTAAAFIFSAILLFFLDINQGLKDAGKLIVEPKSLTDMSNGKPQSQPNAPSDITTGSFAEVSI